MKWLDQLQQGMIGNVKVWMDSSTDYVGRDKVVKEYPFQDWSTVQDMGGVSKPGSFPVYVHGDDVFDQRDALIRILNRKGAVDIIHPWMGLMRVEILGPVSMRHSTAEGGVVRFEIEYLRVPEAAQGYPKVTVNTARLVKANILTARLKAIEDFSQKFSVDNLVGWAHDSSLGAVSTALGDIRSTLDTIISVPAGYVAALDTNFRLFSNLVEGGLSSFDLGTGLMNLLGGLSDFSFSASESGQQRDLLNSTLQRHQTLFNWSSNYEASPYNTPTREQEAANHEALEVLIQTGAVLCAAETVSGTDFTTSWNYVEAMQWRATLNTQFQHLLGVVDSSVYQDVMQTMNAVSDDIVTRSKHLGRISTLRTPYVAMSGLLVSYRHYGTIDYADEIIANNNIAHPLFIPAESLLEVISHDA